MTFNQKRDPVITWTIPMRESLRLAWREAQEHNVDSFVFAGTRFHTGCAGYLLQYLDLKLGEAQHTGPEDAIGGAQ